MCRPFEGREIRQGRRELSPSLLGSSRIRARHSTSGLQWAARTSMIGFMYCWKTGTLGFGVLSLFMFWSSAAFTQARWCKRLQQERVRH